MTKYKIIDKTSDKHIPADIADGTFNIAANIISKQKLIAVGDMFWVRDMLLELGYELWKDFAIKKIEKL